MSINAHITSLEGKHAHLEEVIAEEMARPLPDFPAITNLKKQKLLLKEEIQRLHAGHTEAA